MYVILEHSDVYAKKGYHCYTDPLQNGRRLKEDEDKDKFHDPFHLMIVGIDVRHGRRSWGDRGDRWTMMSVTAGTSFSDHQHIEADGHSSPRRP